MSRPEYIWAVGFNIAVLWLVLLRPVAAASLIYAGATPGPELVSGELDNLQVDATLSGTSAEVTELRTYRMGDATFEVVPLSVVFYRSLLDAETELGAVNVEVGGVQSALSGRVLSPIEADVLRKRLLIELNSPALLRELGQPLFVSEPFEVLQGETVQLTVESRAQLSRHGTLRGISVPLDWHERNVPVVDVSLGVQTEEPLRAVYSPYHELALQRQSDHEASATSSSRDVCSRFDITLMLSTGEEEVHLDVLPFRYGDVDGGFFMALLTPALETQGQSLGRDIVLALDISGSMQGQKIVQAKQALSEVIDDLNEQDTLSLVSFSGVIETFSAVALQANAANKTAALAFVAELVAEGGTDLDGALQAALDLLVAQSERPRYVVLLTDGQPTEGETDVMKIADNANAKNEGRARIFPMGIGDDVNTILLDRLASGSSGRAIYLRSQPVTVAVQDFFSSIADPILSNPELSWNGIEVSQVFPETLPDLFSGQSLTVVGRYAQAGASVLNLRGIVGGGAVGAQFDVNLPGFDFSHGFVPRLWALRYVGELLKALKLDAANEKLKAEVYQVARRFGVVTEFTFFRLEENDDLAFEYSDVPTDAVGSRAVDTSASLSGYASSETAGGSVDTLVRYFQDRNFPAKGGYLTDSSLNTEDPDWVNLHFGSERYFEFAETENDYAAGGFLSVGRAMRFEHLGRYFRVIDTAQVVEQSVLTEVASVPVAERAPARGVTSVTAKYVRGDAEAQLAMVLTAGNEARPELLAVAQNQAKPLAPDEPLPEKDARPWPTERDAAGAPELGDAGVPSHQQEYETVSVQGGGGCSLENGSRPLPPPAWLALLGGLLWSLRRGAARGAQRSG